VSDVGALARCARPTYSLLVRELRPRHGLATRRARDRL